MEQQRNHIEFLIRAVNYFISHPNEEFYDDIPKKAVNYLVYEEIKLFDPQLKYKDFRKSTLEERKTRLESYLPKSIAVSVPQNLEVFMEQLEEHELKTASEKQKGTIKRDYRSSVNFARQVQVLVSDDPEISVEGAADLALLPVAIDEKKKQDLLNRARKDSVNLTQQITDSLVVEVLPQNQQQINQIGLLAKNYVDQLATAQVDSPFVIINAPQIKNNFESGKTFSGEDVFTEIPQSTPQNQKNISQLLRIAKTRPETLQANLLKETGSDEFAGVFTSGASNLTSVFPIIPVISTAQSLDIAAKAQEIVGQVTGPIAETVFNQAVSTTTPITETLTPFQAFIIPQAVHVSLPEAAKKDPVNATAKAFYYLHGYTKNTFNVVAKEVGLTPSQTKSFTDYLGTFQTAHPDFAALLASERASLNSTQIERIFTGPGTLYQNYMGQLPPVTGIRGFFLRATQQTLGRTANNYVNGAIKSGLARAGAAAIKKVAASAIGKAITGVVAAASNVLPVLGPILTWIVSKVISKIFSFIAGFVKKHIRPIMAIIGGFGGLVIFGPIGAIVGGVAGVGLVGGLAGGSITAGVAAIGTGLAAFFAPLAGVVLIPLLITIIGIPVAVVFVLFVINSGAYVVPAGQPISVSNPFAGVANSANGNPNLTCGRGTASAAPNTSAGQSIAQRASQIANNLKPGFWKDLNYSPDYPNLFSQSMFQSNPNPPYPGPIQSCGDCLFWCTWLVQKSYRENGVTNLSSTLGVGPMCSDFAARGKFISARNATSTNIVPGSAVFFSVSGGFDHVGVVVSVNQDSIEYVQSDALTKGGSITFSSGGTGVQNIGGLVVIGFGLP